MLTMSFLGLFPWPVICTFPGTYLHMLPSNVNNTIPVFSISYYLHISWHIIGIFLIVVIPTLPSMFCPGILSVHFLAYICIFPMPTMPSLYFPVILCTCIFIVKYLDILSIITILYFPIILSVHFLAHYNRMFPMPTLPSTFFPWYIICTFPGIYLHVANANNAISVFSYHSICTFPGTLSAYVSNANITIHVFPPGILFVHFLAHICMFPMPTTPSQFFLPSPPPLRPRGLVFRCV